MNRTKPTVSKLYAGQLEPSDVGKTIRFQMYYGHVLGRLDSVAQVVNEWTGTPAMRLRVSWDDRWSKAVKTHWLSHAHLVELIEDTDGQD